MLDANVITTLEKNLQETRRVQSRLIARLRDIEEESIRLREEIQALETGAKQTEAAIDSLLLAMRTSTRSMAPDLTDLKREVANIEGQIRVSDTPDTGSPQNGLGNVAYFDAARNVPSRAENIEAVSQRFADRTITQACTLLIREAGQPLHVNELYNMLVAGGMEFRGNNPTISIAVSLNRNRRFVKVDPGTFDLAIRDVARRAS